MDRWTSGADYDRWMGRWSRVLAEEFLGWLALPPKLRWLDVCCGSGVLTEAIVERCSPVRVAGVDVSPQQVAFARSQRAGPGVTFEIGDAQALPFADASFDAVVSGLGLQYLSRPDSGLGEMRRSAASGGIIAIYIWDYAEGTHFLRKFWDAAAAVDPGARASDQARRFSWCNPEGLRRLFEDAGFAQIVVRALDIRTRFTDFDDYWQPFLGGQGTAPSYLATCNGATRDAIRERLRESLPTKPGGVIELPARAWAVRGTRGEIKRPV